MSLEYDPLSKTIECHPASIRRKEDIETIFEDCADAGIAFVLFGTSQKRHVRIIGEKQIVDGFSTLHVIMDL
jgi:hypothetical protein